MATRRPSTNRTPRPRLSQDEANELCHSFGHEWRHGGAFGIDDTTHGFRPPFGARTGMLGFHSTCGVCTTQKVRWVTRSGESINRYDYAEGYSKSTKRGDEVLTPQEYRQRYVTSIFDAFEAQAGGKRA